ncbi:MAG: glutaredoxin family protein [Endomicrobiaceae bacterium]|nr:glutaredoxin family protein [Endomicrobiaceae bacterium]MDD3053805.1 glutaredoxin family protein [Endomicrobiaceae bacterium]MDD5101583.1 glutaredoxin family protein [Endomicrobiaceae bacterium]
MKSYNKIVLYSLSTCFWCAKIKKLLQELSVEFQEIYVDLLDEKELEKIMFHLKAKDTFPILKLDDNYIIGYEEESIRKLFEN